MREEHLEWLIKNFLEGEYNSILDVGCDKNYLREILKPQRYVGVDISEKADFKLDLDKVEKLPFSDGEFDLVFSSNLVEHLENIHLIVDEIIRTGKLSVITTPPLNSWDIIMVLFFKKRNKNIDRKHFGKYYKFYGLPLEKPSDRHRWLFFYDELVDFIKYRAGKQGKKVEVFERYSSKKRELAAKIFGKNFFVNEVIFKIS